MWSQWPTEIEADLADRGHDIRDWHRGVMSSRRLLVLLEHAPTLGPYKLARRGYRQTRTERVAEETYNEVALLRASFHAAYGGEDAYYEPDLLKDPVDDVDRQREKAEEAAAREQSNTGDFFGGQQWTW